MNRQRIKIYLAAGVLLTALTGFSIMNRQHGWVSAWKPINLMEYAEQADHQAGYLINVMDNNGNIISKAARGMASGDEILFPDGKHYRITRVGGNYARAKYLGKDKQMMAYNDFFSSMALPASAMARNGNNTVGIYHTHSDESYVPTDGSEAIPFKGGIYQVGQSLVTKLTGKGIDVAYNRTPHDPHDNNAYYRSRRTATELMKNNPVAILDVHRDGVPDPYYYRKTVSDTNVAQLRLVIGRQNPNMNANLDFAKRMMAYANKVHPTIVKEIFMAKGNYNQDLMPTALLIEAGTHMNTKQEAENGVALFADAIPTVLGITGAPGGRPGGVAAPGGGGAWKALAWILGLTIIGGGAFLLVSSGGLDKAKSRLSSYMSREFTGFMGPLRTRGRRQKKRHDRWEEENIRDMERKYSPDANEIDRENRNKIR